MENGTQVITPSMALLIGYVAREAGVEVADGQRSRRAAPAKRERTVARLGIPSGVRQLHADSAGIAARIIVAIS